MNLFRKTTLFLGLALLSTTFAWSAPAPDGSPGGDRITVLKSELDALKDHVRVLEERLAAEEQKSVPSTETPSEFSPEKLQELDQQVKILQRQKELDQEAALAKAATTPIVSAGKDGFGLKSPTGDYNLKLRGYIQGDSRFFLDDDEELSNDTFLLRRVRPIFEGTVFEHYDFRFMPDFGGGSTTLQDAYVNIHYWPEATLQFGKFKPPVGLERLQSGANLTFIERGFPTNLVPNRDVGVQLGGDLFDGTLSYAVGAFNGVPDGGSGDLDLGDSKDMAARIFAQPFKNSDNGVLQGLGFGVAGTFGEQTGTLGTYKTFGQGTFFTYGKDVVAEGDRYRISPQAYYYWNSLGLLAEYALSSQDVAKGDASYGFDNEAWQIELSYVLTGENASYKGVKPKKNFSLKDGTWGAFEVAARYGQLNVDDDIFAAGFADPTKSADGAEEYVLGLNWYLSSNVKSQVNFAHTEFSGGAAGGDRDAEDAILTRLQLSF